MRPSHPRAPGADPSAGPLATADELLAFGEAFLELAGDWRILRVNANQERLSRTPRSRSLGRVFWEVWPEAADPDTDYWREYHRCMDERVPVQFEAYYAPLDLWTGVTAFPISTGGIAVFFRDISPQKRAEAALAGALERAEEERRRLAAVLDALPAGLVITDAKGGFTHVNAEFKRIWGAPPTPRSAEEYADWNGWWPDTGRPVATREWALSRALATGEVIAPGDVVEVEKFDGSGRATIINAAAPIRDAGGAIVGGVLAEVDITAQRRAEEALRLSEAKFRSVFEQAAIGMGRVRFDDARWIDVNDAFCRMLGRSREEMLATPWPRMTHPEDLDLDLVPFRQMAAGELSSYTVEKRFLHADGHDVWARLTLSLVRRADGAPDYEIAIIEDVSDRKGAEEALRRSEAALDAFFAQSPGILNLEDEEFRIVNTDPTTPTYFGLTRESIVGRSLKEIAPEMVARYGAMMTRVIETGEPRLNVEVDGPVSGRPGESTHWRASYFPVPLPSGRRGIGVMGLEITDLKRAEQALREADQRKTEFLGVLSHELRNPLAPIRNSIYLLERLPRDSPQATRAREVIRRQAEHLTRLVDDLLDVTRISRGKIQLHREEVDLAALVQRAAEDHRAVLQERDLELAVEVPDRPVVVDGDATRLAQVVGNLLQNAQKFTPAGGRVAVAVTTGDGRASVHVRDTGAGIDPGMLETIFEPFTQAQQTLARTEGGLGLGLALVKALVELHGGEVSASSAGTGRGTEFVVTLPLAPARAEPVRASAEVRGGGAGASRRVLVIDDNRDSADSLGELVSMFGHEVDVSYDPYDALARASTRPPDVVLCDIGLPGMDGYEVARQLRALAGRRRVQLVAVSGYAQPDDVSRATEAGFDAHVAKPPDPEKLERLLSAAP